MSTVHELSGPGGPVETQPSMPWPGAGGPSGPGEGGAGPGGPGGPRRGRRRTGVLALGLAAAAVGSALAVGALPSSGQVLTTPEIVARVTPGLVDVTSTLGYQNGVSAGTGMVLTSSGEVLTNNHVVEGATSIRVTDLGNGRTYRAVVAGYSRSSDIAVLQLQGASGLKTVTLGGSAGVKVGQKVVALGNAGGRGGAPSVAVGRVTGLGKTIRAADAATGAAERLTGLIRSDAAVRAGDSGGPLASTAGQVVGVNTAASARFSLSVGPSETQAFTIPIDRAEAIATRIEAHQGSATIHIGRTAFLGVQIVSTGSASGSGGSTGVAVAGVIPGSPVAQAGVSAGDVITAVGGHKVTSPSALQSLMDRYHPSTTVALHWTDQSGQAHSAAVLLANGPVG